MNVKGINMDVDGVNIGPKTPARACELTSESQGGVS